MRKAVADGHLPHPQCSSDSQMSVSSEEPCADTPHRHSSVLFSDSDSDMCLTPGRPPFTSRMMSKRTARSKGIPIKHVQPKKHIVHRASQSNDAYRSMSRPNRLRSVRPDVPLGHVHVLGSRSSRRSASMTNASALDEIRASGTPSDLNDVFQLDEDMNDHDNDPDPSETTRPVNDNQDHPQAEVCPVFDEDWGIASTADNWCFMCVKRVPQHQLLQNEYYRRLLQLFEQARHLRTVDLCTNIQRFYMENFAAAHGNQEWTLRSIRSHIYEHLGVSSAFVQDDLVRTLYAQTRLYKESGLRLRDVSTGKVHVNFKGMHSYLQCVRMLLHVMKQ
jgi:hypothetical protein